MSEQQSQQATTVVKATTTSACPHPEAVGKRWGDRISAQRQAELQAFLDRWEHEEDHGQRRGPFDVTWRDPYILDISLGDFEDDDAVERSNPEFYKGRLTGADIYWLARQSRYRLMGGVPNLHLEGANLLRAHLEGAGLSNVHLEGANLTEAHLEGAILFKAHLQNALLPGTHVENATLSVANLEGADLRSAHLDGASLRGVWLNSKTLLGGGSFDDKTRLGDIQWSGVGAVNLTQINWERVPTLGDEQGVGLRAKAVEHEAVVRAYRQLAAQLHAQGMNEVADRFLYRAQVRQRGVLLRQGKVGAYLFSLLVLAALAGYGFRLRRILVAYGLTLVAFAAAYFALGQWLGGTHLEWYESLLVSLTAIHGRVFFTQFGLDNLQSWVAAVESVVGIVIEGVFVAMLIQRFFGR